MTDQIKQEQDAPAMKLESEYTETVATTEKAPVEKPVEPAEAAVAAKTDEKVSFEEFDRTRKALTKANDEAKTRRLKLQEWDELGVDTETVKLWKQERDKAELTLAEEEGRYQEIIEKTRTQAKADNDKFQAERDEMKTQLESYLIDKNLTEAIAAEEGVPRLLQGIAKSYVKTVQDEQGKYSTVVVDEDGLPRKNKSGVAMSVRELVKSFRDDPELAYAFKAPHVSGAGTDSQAASAAVTKKTGPTPHRGVMSPREQRDYVAKHGYEEFRKLPR